MPGGLERVLSPYTLGVLLYSLEAPRGTGKTLERRDSRLHVSRLAKDSVLQLMPARTSREPQP